MDPREAGMIVGKLILPAILIYIGIRIGIAYFKNRKLKKEEI